MKSVLITGANGGIGLACAREFLLKWPEARVFLGCRSAMEMAQSLQAEFPDRTEILTLEVTDETSWNQAVEKILVACNRLDVLVNNAGSHRDSLLATMPLADWHSVLSTNLTGTFLGCRAVIRPMLSQKFGRIINIASLSALLAPAGQTNYAAAKAGVVALTQSFAKEVARAGITVNAICPGYIASDALSTDPTAQAQLAQRVPARRLGQPSEVAAAVLYFASPEAAYTTGSALKLDGGIL